jgi:peptide deformylase
MAVLEIRTFPDPILKQRCADVTAFDADLHQFLDDMAQTMQEAEGLGLAANQVGRSIRLFLMDVPTGKGKDGQETRTGLLEIINPKLVAKRGEMKWEEGCLSFPNVYEWVTRSHDIVLQYQDRHGEPKELKASGLVAICAQHEFDHLEGVTFLDRLSPLKRRLALQSYQRQNAEALQEAEYRAKKLQRKSAAQSAS